MCSPKLALIYKLTPEPSWHALVFMCLLMIPQADMTSEAHMSPQADIVILPAEVISQPDIILQADTRTKLTRLFYLLFHESTG